MIQNSLTEADLQIFMVEAKGRFMQGWDFRADLEKLLISEPNGASMVTDYNGQYAHVTAVETYPGYAIAGTGLPQAKKGGGVKVAFGTETDYQNIEIGYKAAKLAEKAPQNWPGLISQVDRQVRNTIEVLRDATSYALLADGSGRLAKISETGVANSTWVNDAGTTLNTSTIYLDPVFCRAADGARSRSSVAYLRRTMAVDFVSYDEADPTSATVVADGSDKEGYEICEIVASSTNHASYVKVYPRVPGGVVAGMYLCRNQSLNAVPIGLMGMFGDGSITGSMPRWGLKNYGSFSSGDFTVSTDRSSTKYAFFRGACYNLASTYFSDPTAEVTLGREEMLKVMQFGEEFSRAAGKTASYDALITSPDVWRKYSLTGAALYTPFSNTSVVHPDLGIQAPTYTDPLTGKSLPVLVIHDLPPDMLAFVSKGTIMKAMVHADWDKGSEYGYFTRMLKFYPNVDILRAVYSRIWFLMNLYPSHLLTVSNINIS